MNSRPSEPTTREALYAHAEAYLDALEAQDPSRLAWADKVVFTENNVQLAIGDGLWNTISARRRTYDLKAADPQTGQVSWFGLVEEHGHPAIMGLRLGIVAGLIAEVETIVCRSMEFGPFPSIETYVSPRPLMLADVPDGQRRERARMISVADGYFDTLQLNDGTLFTEFTDDCDRVENGLQTTNNPNIEGYPIAAMGCAEQFRLGQYIYDDRLRGRRFPLVDEEKGIVVAAGFIDHCGKVVDVTWTDGVTKTKSVFHFPHSFALLEMFKIVDGKIAGVEAVFVTVPYNMPSPWEG
ncbi:hypothetical protein KK137_12930 [Croceibacterium sp. LX-88]|jgi:hypothetical protein|uniref:DUF8021 domain-containing protein n=1 Tax=Croceibacterium selenioxidans TaxID=2838833 RepID=A0ABS5W9Y5_9SPHN|nr:hypothetical protein [Croceibacterium selenioxidans]MBT2135234.1 hypothetical protein [Croceibacterium selenioxidans]